MTELADRTVSRRPVIAIHAGAGDHGQELRDHESECRQALTEALRAGRAALDEGLDATHAVQRAVVVLEDFELFNAGRGATLCSDGSVEMSAALMRGTDRAAGAVAVVRHTQNPILAARAVLESPQVLLVGPAADERAELAGVAQQPNEYFVTERQHAHLANSPRATVGAVCLDGDGVLAAATSTGGIQGQPRGRVGDCPVFGAGTWADAHAAVSCTGDGEAFIRSTTGTSLAASLRWGATVSEAAERALQEVANLQATGGLIVVDAGGNVDMPFNTQVMPRGLWRSGDEPTVWIA